MLRLTAKRPLGVKVALAAEIFLAIASISGGRILLDDLSGKTMVIEPMIPYLPFNLLDFTLVGVWLIAAYGALPLILAAGLWLGRGGRGAQPLAWEQC